MKKLLLIVVSIVLFSCAKHDEKEKGVLEIHKGKFAFCGASGAVPTGKKIIIQGVEYYEGCAICPVLDGPSVSNLAMEGKGGTWGQFNPETNKWELLPPYNRSFTVNVDSPATSESNMFCMPCIIFDTTSTGIVLAKCYGPLNEAAVPLHKAIPVTSGMTSITAAKKGVPYPVGTPIPTNK